jgi:DNA-directed RNA polymerase specialized sigma24 family protein
MHTLVSSSDPKSPPPAAPPSSPTLAPPPEPAPDLVAHLTSNELRLRLLGSMQYHEVPERKQEEVVQTALAEMWRQRHSWPATVVELEKLLFTVLRFDRIDSFREDGKEPLLEEAEPEPGPPTAGDDLGDGDAPAVVLPDPVIEARLKLQEAEDYVESRPNLRVSFGWLVENARGKSVKDIAAESGSKEKTVENSILRLREQLHRVGIFILYGVAFAAIATIVYVMHGA